MKNCLLILLLFATPALAGQNVVMVVDDSGSMGAYMEAGISRIEAAKLALKETVNALPNDTRIGIVTLNGYWEPERWLVPFGVINKKQATEQIDQLRDTGGTPLASAMKAGCDVLLADREKNGYGIYTLLVVTDGEANDPSTVDIYVDDIKSRGITIDAIGVDMAQDHSLATKVHAYRRANDPASLVQAISETFAETNTADQASVDEDFALLAGLPDGVAPKLIEAMVKGNNAPIGEKPELVTDEAGNFQFDASGNVVTAPPSGLSMGNWIFIIIGVAIAFVILIAFVAVNS